MGTPNLFRGGGRNIPLFRTENPATYLSQLGDQATAYQKQAEEADIAKELFGYKQANPDATERQMRDFGAGLQGYSTDVLKGAKDSIKGMYEQTGAEATAAKNAQVQQDAILEFARQKRLQDMKDKSSKYRTDAVLEGMKYKVNNQKFAPKAFKPPTGLNAPANIDEVFKLSPTVAALMSDRTDSGVFDANKWSQGKNMTNRQLIDTILQAEATDPHYLPSIINDPAYNDDELESARTKVMANTPLSTQR